MACIGGEYAEAERCCQDSVATYSETENAWGITNVHNDLCLVARPRGAFPQAKRRAIEAPVKRREIGDQVGTAASLGNLVGTLRSGRICRGQESTT